MFKRKFPLAGMNVFQGGREAAGTRNRQRPVTGSVSHRLLLPG